MLLLLCCNTLQDIGDRREKFEVQGLNNADATALFSYRLKLKGDVMPSCLTLQPGIIAACGGVPLALQVAAGLLDGDNNMGTWEVSLFLNLCCGVQIMVSLLQAR